MIAEVRSAADVFMVAEAFFRTRRPILKVSEAGFGCCSEGPRPGAEKPPAATHPTLQGGRSLALVP